MKSVHAAVKRNLKNVAQILIKMVRIQNILSTEDLEQYRIVRFIRRALRRYGYSSEGVTNQLIMMTYRNHLAIGHSEDRAEDITFMLMSKMNRGNK